MTKFNITAAEQRKLKVVCWWTGLSFNAMAARPQIARELIATHYDTARKADAPFNHVA